MKFLQDLKKIQKRIWLKTSIIILVLGLPFIKIFITANSLEEFFGILVGFCFLECLCGYWLIKSFCSNDIEKYKKIYSKNITLEILKSIFEDVKYIPEDEILPEKFGEIINSADIVGTNRFSNNDYILGKYKNINFEYCDLTLGHESKNPDSNIKEKFKGKWIVLTFNTKFKSNIQIGPKIFNGRKQGQMIDGKNYEVIESNDLELNKNFIIYADNKTEAFNILNPDIINKLKELYNKAKGKIFVFYLDNQLQIGYGDKKDFFEPNILKKIDVEKETVKILNQINIIVDLIDYLIKCSNGGKNEEK